MAHGVARIPQADHTINGQAVAGLPDIRQPVGHVRGALPSEAILRCDQQRRFVSALFQCAHELAGHDEMPAFRKRRTRGRDDDGPW